MSSCVILSVGSKTDDEGLLGERLRLVDSPHVTDEAIERALSLGKGPIDLHSRLQMTFQPQRRLTPAEWTALEDAVVAAARAHLDGLDGGPAAARCCWPHYGCDGAAIRNGLCDEHLRVAGE